MGEKIITLSRPVDLGTGAIPTLTLRDMDAGDYFDAAAELRPNASRAELEAQVAAICAGVPMAVVRKCRPADLAKVSKWYDEQWSEGTTATGEPGADPLKADAAK
jgi:hypothetical protein